MRRTLAGVFGVGAEAAGSAARRSLEAPSGGVSYASFAAAWAAGSDPPAESLILLLSGRVRNLHALSAELGVEDERDVERILSVGFNRWGEGMLAKLRGGFALVVWDRATRTGFLAVDQLGVGSLFLNESAGRLSFATEIRTLVRLLPVRPTPDPRGLVQWIADGYMGRGETLLAGVRRLEGGHLVRLEDDRWRQACYWSPRYVAPAASTTAEAAVQVRRALTQAVGERMAHDGPTGVLLSGGLDSSTVAAVARRLDPPPGPVRTYSLVHPEHADVDESALIARVTQALDLQSELTPILSTATLPTALEYQRSWELPPETPMLAFTLPLLRGVAQEDVQVILDGEGGDELFGCSQYLIADRLRGGSARGAFELIRRLPDLGDSPSRQDVWALFREYGVKGAVPHGFHRALRRLPGGGHYAPSLLAPRSAALYLEACDNWAWKQLEGPRWWAFLVDLLTSWRERIGHDYFRHRALLAGLENGHPLLDDLDLIELVLRLPPELAFDPELTRPVIRQAVVGLLPDEIRLRRTKADFSSLLVDALNGPDRPLVEELLGARSAELFAYVDPARVRALLETPTERRNVVWARLVWRLVTTETWLRSQADPHFPLRILERQGHVVNDDEPPASSPRRGATS